MAPQAHYESFTQETENKNDDLIVASGHGNNGLEREDSESELSLAPSDTESESSEFPLVFHKKPTKSKPSFRRHKMAIDTDDKFAAGVVFAFLSGVFTLLIKHFTFRFAVYACIFAGFLIHQLFWRRRKLPPGPTPLPFLGNTLSVDMRHPAKSFKRWHAQYGPVFTVWLPHPMVVLASHEVLKEALVKKGSSFAGRPQGYIWSMFTKNPDHGDGIILCEGERWSEIREFSHKIFRDFGLGRLQMEDKIKTHIHGMTKKIDMRIGDSEESVMDMEEPISLCVAHIIQDFVLGKSYDLEDAATSEKKIKKFKKLIDAVLADVASKMIQMVNAYPVFSYLPLPALRRYSENGFALQRYFLHAIHEHREHLTMDGEPRDFMEAFLREMDKQKENPHFNPMTLALAAGDLWTGGMETTVTTIRWAIIHMMYHPTVQRRCREEIDRVFGAEEPAYAERTQLPYVEATIAELLRIVNVLPWAIPHRTLEDTEVFGYDLPKGTVILPQYGTVQFDTHYFDEPEVFRPERFLDSHGYYKKRPELNPFGMGKRTCLGENLARYELFLILTSLLQKYEFLPIEGSPLPSLRRSEGMTNVPEHYKCRIVRRQPLF